MVKLAPVGIDGGFFVLAWLALAARQSAKTFCLLRTLASVESRFEALHTSGLTELIGREEELELLLCRWSKSKTGNGQVVLLSGEAGIGKSRLTAALLERLVTEPARHWGSGQMDTSFAIAAPEEPLSRFGRPAIFNTD
jgi:hypothetical protein